MEQEELKFITCSGANEFTDIKGMIALSEEFPIIEWGIQVSGKKCSIGSLRWDWIHELQNTLQHRKQLINLALHVNADWVENFTRDERLEYELGSLLELKNPEGGPLFSRVQLNFKIGRERMPIENILTGWMFAYQEDRRFIFSYNDENKMFIHRLYKNGLRDFDVLHDSSHGEGISAQQWKEPAFFDEDILQGYAGGLSPDNVMDEVTKIRKVLLYDRAFYIDAEGKLKGDDKHLSLDKCREYVLNALKAMYNVKN